MFWILGYFWSKVYCQNFPRRLVNKHSWDKALGKGRILLFNIHKKYQFSSKSPAKKQDYHLYKMWYVINCFKETSCVNDLWKIKHHPSPKNKMYQFYFKTANIIPEIWQLKSGKYILESLQEYFKNTLTINKNRK